MCDVRYVMESPPWISLRAFLASVLYMRAGLYGPFAELADRWQGKTPPSSRVAKFTI